MSLAGFAIHRWQLAMVLFVLLAALGVSAFLAIPRSVDPHFPTPVTIVVATLPGADAREMEETVAKPIEEIASGLDDVSIIESSSREGNSVIVVEFSWSGDPERYFNDAVREITAARGNLPADLRLDFRKVRTANAAAVQVALVSDTASWRRMDKYARDLTEAFQRDPAVQRAAIAGLPQSEVTVALRTARLAELGIPASAIADALRLGGADVPSGTVVSGTRAFDVKAGGAYRSLDAIRALPVRAGSGSLLTVGDLADVGWGAEEQRVRSFHDGHRALFITASQKDGADTGQLSDRLIREVETLRSRLPPDLDLVVEFDQSKDIRHRMGELARDFAIALALVLVTLTPLGLRAAGIVMVSIPLSLASGVLALWLAGYNLNQLSIAGFILSLGLLVDDSIVVLENIARHMRMGKPRIAAALDATREITPAVIGATGVLVFAFVPILFLPEGPGAYIRSMGWSVIFTVSASMLVSLSLIPFLSSRILPADADPHGNRVLQRLTAFIDRFYHPVLTRTLDAPRATVYGALAVTLSAFLLIPLLGFALFPAADTAHFRVTVEAEQGTSLDATQAIVRRVSAIMATEPAIRVRAATVGSGNPQVYYNVQNNSQYPGKGEVLGVLNRWDGAKSEAMVQRLRAKLRDVPGARISVVLFQNGAPVIAPVAFRVRGPDLAVLKRISGQVETILDTTPGARDVFNPVATDRVDLDVGLDEGKGALLDIPAGAPRRALRLALSGERAGSFRDEEGDSYPVVVRLPLAGSQPVSALDRVYVPTRGGRTVPLGQITDPKLVTVPASIARYQLERSVTVTSQVEDGALPSRVTADAMAKIAALRLPAGYAVNVGGEAEKLDAVLQGFGSVILVTVFGILAILVAEFGRFRETIVVAGVVPLGTFGGFVALLLTGNAIGFTAIIGFVALIGIEIKNSILLVDFTAQLRAQGVPLREAVEKAGEVRFMPVLLTSVTAIGGLLPLALFGGSLYGVLATVIIGGLVSSTLLSRFVTPAMYLLVARRSDARPLADDPAQPM